MNKHVYALSTLPRDVSLSAFPEILVSIQSPYSGYFLGAVLECVAQYEEELARSQQECMDFTHTSECFGFAGVALMRRSGGELTLHFPLSAPNASAVCHTLRLTLDVLDRYIQEPTDQQVALFLSCRTGENGYGVDGELSLLTSSTCTAVVAQHRDYIVARMGEAWRLLCVDPALGWEYTQCDITRTAIVCPGQSTLALDMEHHWRGHITSSQVGTPAQQLTLLYGLAILLTFQRGM